MRENDKYLYRLPGRVTSIYMFSTRTGNFPIGFRKGWAEWQKNVPELGKWAKDEGFAMVDVGSNASDAQAIVSCGLKVGSVDLGCWQGLIDQDSGAKKNALDAAETLISDCSKVGAKNFFAVMLPRDPSKLRPENFELMVSGLSALAPILEKHGSKLVIEGWPGAGALCCTPESLRATFGRVPSKAIGINFDPSHLIRMGINPVPFVSEFADRIYHVHGKDTALYPEATYDFGTEISATLAKEHGFGAQGWRYAIPGHGVSNWVTIFEILNHKGYTGGVCIELEDENFNGSAEGEKRGLIASAQFLSSC